MTETSLRVIPAVAALFLIGSGAAQAADLAPSPLPLPAGWIVTVTANAAVGPRYPGSDEFSIIGFPSFSLRHVGEPKRFTTPDDGFSLPVYDTATFRFGIVGRYRGGRYYDDDRRLFGLEDVNWTIEPGVFLEFWPFEMLRLRAEFRHGLGGHDGFVGDVGLDGVFRFGPFTYAIGPRLAWGDQNFMEAYFGVTPWEAALNGLVTPYRPAGGVTSLGAATSLSYDFSETWSATVSASYARLVGDAADSPIVKRFGTDNQFSFGASISYSFTTAGW